MIFFLICYLLFAQAWGDKPPIVYQPRVLDHYQACAATDTTGSDSDGIKSTDYSWVTVNIGDVLPDFACKKQPFKNSWTLITMLIAKVAEEGSDDSPDEVTGYIPCGGENSDYKKANPLLFVAANSDCEVIGSWLSPPDSDWPNGDPKKSQETEYPGALWGLEDSQLRWVMMIWNAGYHKAVFHDYHPTLTAAYGDGLYGASCDNWQSYDSKALAHLLNWTCRYTFAWSGKSKNQNTDDMSTN